MYQKRGDYTTLDEYVIAKTGKTPETLNVYKDKYTIQNLEQAADMIYYAVNTAMPIVVYTDFDVDGQTSAAQFIILLSYLKANFWVYPPMRSKDGYGISKKFIDKLSGQKGLLITADNGIAACEEVLLARQYGWQVLILDHHEPTMENGSIQLPSADLVIDPCALPNGCDFDQYCAAGLTYKLSSLIVQDQQLLDYMLTIAAIGTVADVVSMHEDNRQIVQQGLLLLNTGNTTVGINKIIERLQITGNVTTSNIAFGIAPMLNAASRLETEEPNGFSGSDFAVNALLSMDEMQAAQMAMKLDEMNARRKQITKDTLESLSVRDVDQVAFVKVDAPKGILGIIAAKVTETTGRPAFCFGESNGVCVGSARSGDTTADVNAMLASVKDLLIKGGGHQKAAGFSFKSENMEAIRERLNQYPGIEPVSTCLYDLDLSSNDLVLPTLMRMDSLEPFGKDFEKPVFKLNCNFTQTEFWHAMGKDGNTLRLDLAPGVNAVAFSSKEEFLRHGAPRQFSLIGTPKWNLWQGNKKPQFEVKAIEY